MRPSKEEFLLTLTRNLEAFVELLGGTASCVGTARFALNEPDEESKQGIQEVSPDGGKMLARVIGNDSSNQHDAPMQWSTQLMHR